MIPDTPEQLHHKEASELQSNVSAAQSEFEARQQNTTTFKNATKKKKKQA